MFTKGDLYAIYHAVGDETMSHQEIKKMDVTFEKLSQQLFGMSLQQALDEEEKAVLYGDEYCEPCDTEEEITRVLNDSDYRFHNGLNNV